MLLLLLLLGLHTMETKATCVGIYPQPLAQGEASSPLVLEQSVPELLCIKIL
jgi:hypothetical protein